MSPIRFFTCHACGHPQRCGKCHDATPPWNRRGAPVLMLLVLLLGIGVLVTAL